MRVGLPIFIVVALTTTGAWASGYHINEQDARATGRAGAVIASPTNASTIFYNPGGIAALDGLHAELGVALVQPRATFFAAGTNAETELKNNVIPLAQAYATYRITSAFSAGLGYYSPWGLLLTWPESSPGRTDARHIELRTWFISPTAGLNLSEWVPGLSIGATLELVIASVRLDQDILFGTDAGSVALSANTFSMGGVGGIYYRPKGFEELGFGVRYRSPVKLGFTGNVNFDAPPIYRAALPPDGQAHTTLTLPQTWDFGVSYRLIPDWEIELDVNWTNWSTFKSLFIELPAGQSSITPKNWHDATTIRFGTGFNFARIWSARLGGGWDKTPVPPETLDFQLPDANRVFLTAGVGAELLPLLRADVGAHWIAPAHQTTAMQNPFEPPVKGRFDVAAWILQATVAFKLGGTTPAY